MGIELYYESHGEGPTIVFAHGAGGSHLSWWQQVPYFSRDYRCITFDHRGFHLSPDIDGRGATAFVDDLTGLLDHLEVREACLVAQSMGGRTAFGFALAQPERVKALVMADTVGGIPSAAISARRQEIVESRASLPRGPSYSPSLVRRDPARAFLYEQMRALNTEERAVDPPATPSPDADLSDFHVPTLFLYGTDDALSHPDLGRLATSVIGSARFVEVADAGHSVYFERPDEFNEIVSRFFKEVSG